MTEPEQPEPDFHTNAHTMLIPAYLLDTQQFIADRVFPFISSRPMTPEEKAESQRKQEERESKAKAEHAAQVALYDDLMARAWEQGAQQLVRDILELHKPEDTSWAGTVCRGCDYSGYEGEPPEWPCSTVDLVLKQYGPKVVDGA